MGTVHRVRVNVISSRGRPDILLIFRLGLAAYIYSLDSQTTYAYLTFAASDLNDHSLISSIQTAQSIISELHFSPLHRTSFMCVRYTSCRGQACYRESL